MCVERQADAKRSHISQNALENGLISLELGTSMYKRLHWLIDGKYADPDGPANLCGAKILKGNIPLRLKAEEHDFGLPTTK